MMGSGTLYIVATPIGNLGDISARAVEVLSQVTIVAAEDTRHSGKLLKHLGIETKLRSYHDFSSEAAEQSLMNSLANGDDVALISDAGTPLVSDPGFKLVRAARDADYKVLPIPGPSALLAAISVAGLPTDRFAFEGFLPAREGARNKRLSVLVDETRTLVFFEAPHRLGQTLQSMLECIGESREIFIAREMTKRFEEHFSGNLASSVEWANSNENAQKGELVLVLSGNAIEQDPASDLAGALRLFSLLRESLSLKQSVKIAAEYCGVRKNELYEQALLLEKDGES